MKFDGITIIVLVLSLLLLMALIFSLASSISGFSQKIKYINLEIKRSGSSKERERWKRKKRKMWLRVFFPFVK